MTIYTIASFICSFLVTAAVGIVLVPYLRKVKAGQMIKEDGPTWHMSKQGTPTMGGLMFIAGMIAACLTAGMRDMVNGDLTHIFVLVFALIYGAIGFLDDYQKLRKKQNTGLTASQKFILQLVVAIVFVLVMRFTGALTPDLYVPFVNVTIPLPEIVYVIFAVFVILGCVNAVNLTDGVDGLATGVSIPVALCFTALSLVWGLSSSGVVSAALLGGLCAFLIFNFHPAKVFMGDTGSLFLGAAICASAFALNMPLALIPLGIVYICEALSDIIQVGYFKLTHGKRVFKMAPLHHHFEMCGWSEYKLFIVFTAVSLIMAVVTFIAVKGRFLI